MAHYAFLDSENVVTEVIVGKDENEGGIDWEQYYGAIRNQTCKRTSYNTFGNVHKEGGIAFRKNYASIGMAYSEEHDGFYSEQPYSSWILNTSTLLWEAPTPKPNDGKFYAWSEDTTQWIEVDEAY
jgi:hypothetical protein